MSIRNYPGLVTGRSARLPGDYVPQATEAEIKHAAQFEPGAVTPGAVIGPTEIRLELGWPPSINSYWQLGVNPKTHQRLLKMSAEGKRYNQVTKAMVRNQIRGAGPIECRVAVLIEAWGPREAWGDCDNRIKPLLDALTKAGLWIDDKVVRDVRIVDRGRFPGGKVVVWVRPLRKD